jgi:hypothetical protein|nr:MAG TPA: hypothetical protein [Caudoviricetes sp.]
MATQAQLRANDELIHIKMIMFPLVVYTKREEKIMVENTGFEFLYTNLCSRVFPVKYAYSV